MGLSFILLMIPSIFFFFFREGDVVERKTDFREKIIFVTYANIILWVPSKCLAESNGDVCGLTGDSDSLSLLCWAFFSRLTFMVILLNSS